MCGDYTKNTEGARCCHEATKLELYDYPVFIVIQLLLGSGVGRMGMVGRIGEGGVF